MEEMINMLPGLVSALPNLGAAVYLVLVFLKHQKERDDVFNTAMKRLDDSAAAREDKMLAALARCALAIGEFKGTLAARKEE